MRRILPLLLLISVIVLNLRAEAQDTIPIAEYSSCFTQIKQMCSRNKMWGIDLWAPLMCIDENCNIVSNKKDKLGNLQRRGDVYVGAYPEDKIIANSTTDLWNEKWTIVMSPLPVDSIDRISLICHEMFHYWQDSLGLTPTHVAYNNKHMDERLARILLKLEWTAMSAACSERDFEKKKLMLTDGLAVRAYRQQEYLNWYRDEIAFEIHEGLPQYTGLKMASRNDSVYLSVMNDNLAEYMNKEMLVRSYAYMSGEIYGFLLDDVSGEWRTAVGGDSDLGKMLQEYYSINLPDDLKKYCRDAESRYVIKCIYDFENSRDSVKMQEKQRLMALFSKNVIKLPIENINIGFDPNKITPLKGIGSVYRNVRIIDNWGELQTIDDGEILITEDWKNVILPYADEVKINGNIQESNYWRLVLNEK